MWVSTESSFPAESWYLYPARSDSEHFVPISTPEWLLAWVLGTLQAISQFSKHRCHLTPCTPFVYLNKHRKDNIGHISLDWPYQWHFDAMLFGDSLQSSCQRSNSPVEAKGAEEGTWMSWVDPRSGDCVSSAWVFRVNTRSNLILSRSPKGPIHQQWRESGCGLEIQWPFGGRGEVRWHCTILSLISYTSNQSNACMVLCIPDSSLGVCLPLCTSWSLIVSQSFLSCAFVTESFWFSQM